MLDSLIVSLMLLGAASGTGELPFWAVTNNYGLMPQHSGGLALIDAHTASDASRAFVWDGGVSLAASAEVAQPLGDGRLMVDQLYGGVRWSVLSLDLGMKHHHRDFLSAGENALGSLSTTSGSIIWSSNSRSLPGYTLTLSPLTVPYTNGVLDIFGRYGDYRTYDNRYVAGAYLHNMQMGLIFHITDRLDFRFALDHYALWGGVSPIYGRMPLTLDNYLRVILGRSAAAGGDGSTLSDIYNVIGNQLGGEQFRLDWRGEGWSVTLQHDIPYDDGSGMGFQNFPDGVNTLHFGFDSKDRWISDVLFEYGYTMCQSGTAHDIVDDNGNTVILGGLDNYFNNYGYNSGWTFSGRTAGLPLIFPKGTRDGSYDPAGIVMGVENNRLKFHHLALGGKLWHRAPYRLMLTFSRNYGTYFSPYEGESQIFREWGTVRETPLRQFSAAFNGTVPVRAFSGRLCINYGLYCDYGEVLRDTFGATFGIGIKIY